MKLPDFLTETPDGEVLLSGHRIGLFHVVHYYNEGFSPEMIACQYPTLPLALIHKVIAFYLEDRVRVDAYVTSYQGELMRQRDASERRIDLNTLRGRLASRQAIETSSSS